jgi:predicted nucleic acid-binding protein
MTTAADTNILTALWNDDDVLNGIAAKSLSHAKQTGPMVICGAVYAELLAAPGRSAEFIDEFCGEAHIDVEWELDEKIWRAAGAAFQGYAARRRKQGGTGPRRILTDFLIGAHAAVRGYTLLTLDSGVYTAAFPRLAIAKV